MQEHHTKADISEDLDSTLPIKQASSSSTIMPQSGVHILEDQVQATLVQSTGLAGSRRARATAEVIEHLHNISLTRNEDVCIHVHEDCHHPSPPCTHIKPQWGTDTLALSPRARPPQPLTLEPMGCLRSPSRTRAPVQPPQMDTTASLWPPLCLSLNPLL